MSRRKIKRKTKKTPNRENQKTFHNNSLNLLTVTKEDIQEAKERVLPLDLYLGLKGVHKLKLCAPNERSRCVALDELFSEILVKYHNRIDDVLMKLRTPEIKKDKELFIACLFAYIVRDINQMKRQYDICILEEDRGTDVYIRELDYEKKLFQHHPIQICEMPEKFLEKGKRTYSNDPTRRVFEFIKKTKLHHYAKSADALLVWLEFSRDCTIDVLSLRELMNGENSIPFSQVILLGQSGDKDHFHITSAYSRDNGNHFCRRYNYKTRKSANLILKKGESLENVKQSEEAD